MSRHHAQQRLSTWIALVAMLALVLMPMVSRALNANLSAQGWIEICSAQGSRWIALSKSGDSSSAASSVASQAPEGEPEAPSLLSVWEHCDYCSLQNSTPALPSVASVLSLPMELGHEVPELFLQAPRRLHAWSPAQSRAPPLSA